METRKKKLIKYIVLKNMQDTIFTRCLKHCHYVHNECIITILETMCRQNTHTKNTIALHRLPKICEVSGKYLVQFDKNSTRGGNLHMLKLYI